MLFRSGLPLRIAGAAALTIAQFVAYVGKATAGFPPGQKDVTKGPWRSTSRVPLVSQTIECVPLLPERVERLGYLG